MGKSVPFRSEVELPREEEAGGPDETRGVRGVGGMGGGGGGGGGKVELRRGMEGEGGREGGGVTTTKKPKRKQRKAQRFIKKAAGVFRFLTDGLDVQFFHSFSPPPHPRPPPHPTLPPHTPLSLSSLVSTEPDSQTPYPSLHSTGGTHLSSTTLVARGSRPHCYHNTSLV